ncbi:reverse transcriptase domain-containing protein [Tanacetum coccineum]|uniref:Reverse transcriptase domain-containing protein n=1 Tax=Tanacetum coccineum TaxID=301880 RepID=A0ABQ5DEX0_9ASTR
MLTAPIKGKALVMYLSASEESISAVLLAERGKRQVSIYFVIRMLQGAELDYPELEKLILTLVYVARRLRRYFQAHSIQILTKKPIKQILVRPGKSGHFYMEMPSKGDEGITTRRIVTKKENSKLDNMWKLYTDGASSSDGSGAGLMLITPGGKEYTYALRFEFETTNNKAEYEALLAGLRIAKKMEIKSLAIFADSQLMVNQIKGLFEAR